MIFLSGHVCEELKCREGFGFIITPFMGNRIACGQVWAADTGCYAQPEEFSLEKYYRWLEQRDRFSCLFATAPDRLGDWPATLARSLPVVADLKRLGYRPAVVAQDGATAENFPWDACDAVFIGGTTEWKLQDAAVIGLLEEAGRRGKWRHMGRVNSWERAVVAKLRECDSIDGTLLAFGKDANLGILFEWMNGINRQLSLW